MADIRKKVPENVDGLFFVDQTCIDCDTCCQLAPDTFRDTGEHTYVYHQPVSPEEQRSAMRALLACPVGSIGSTQPLDLQDARQDFPLLLEEPVYYCGFNSPKSYGGNSYFIRHPKGNWLIDSPKYLPYLVKRFEEMGGLAYIFLTHEDDVADAECYAKHFGAQRIIHRAELSAQPDAEIVLDEKTSAVLPDGFEAILTPGHTRGHMVLLFHDRFLFTGDHLSWSPERQSLSASRDYCWYSWAKQVESMERLAQRSFEWVLPGHGNRIHMPASRMKAGMKDLLLQMKA